ncbi:MAG: hypothetical protein RIM72_16720 [Alphaproteobacteria bacterium]
MNRHPDWTDRLSQSRIGLCFLSFAESTVVPVPLETIVAPLMIGHPRRSVVIAIVIWLGSLAGAALFYGLGFWLADPVVHPVLEWLDLGDGLKDMTARLDKDGLFWVVFLVSFLPAPLQLATLGAGVAQANFLVFLLAIAASRGLRYGGLAVLALLLGRKIAALNIPTGRLVLMLSGVLFAGWAALQLL